MRWTPTERRELLDVLKAAVGEAGDVVRAGFAGARGAVSYKGEVDLATETDRRSEDVLRRCLTDATDFAFLGEEQGLTGTEGGPMWVADPLDGTTNFAHRVPHFAVSVGLWDGEAVIGAVLAPIPGELFSADGGQAWLGDVALPSVRRCPLDRALVATGFPYDRRTNPDDNVDLFRAFMKRTQGVRRMGAAALDMAFVAAGRLDGFWEPRLKPWDLVGGIALVESVGGRVTNYAGDPWSLTSTDVLAAHPALHAEMQAVLAEHRTS